MAADAGNDMSDANGKVYFVTFQRPVLGLQKVTEKAQPGTIRPGRMGMAQQAGFSRYANGMPEPVISLRYDWVPFSLISDLHPFECLEVIVGTMSLSSSPESRNPPPVLISFQQLMAPDLLDLPDSIFRATTVEDVITFVQGW